MTHFLKKEIASQYDNGKLKIESYVVWPVNIENVEATEVCRIGNRMVFLYAECADSLPSTKLRTGTQKNCHI